MGERKEFIGIFLKVKMKIVINQMKIEVGNANRINNDEIIVLLFFV